MTATSNAITGKVTIPQGTTSACSPDPEQRRGKSPLRPRSTPSQQFTKFADISGIFDRMPHVPLDAITERAERPHTELIVADGRVDLSVEIERRKDD